MKYCSIWPDVCNIQDRVSKKYQLQKSHGKLNLYWEIPLPANFQQSEVCEQKWDDFQNAGKNGRERSIIVDKMYIYIHREIGFPFLNVYIYIFILFIAQTKSRHNRPFHC